jgi:hypothetical protein
MKELRLCPESKRTFSPVKQLLMPIFILLELGFSMKSNPSSIDIKYPAATYNSLATSAPLAGGAAVRG